MQEQVSGPVYPPLTHGRRPADAKTIKRRLAILDLLRQNGPQTVRAIATRIPCDHTTLLRDLNEMLLLKRVARKQIRPAPAQGSRLIWSAA